MRLCLCSQGQLTSTTFMECTAVSTSQAKVITVLYLILIHVSVGRVKWQAMTTYRHGTAHDDDDILLTQ